jgi:hypothetical protein
VSRRPGSPPIVGPARQRRLPFHQLLDGGRLPSLLDPGARAVIVPSP